MSHTPRVPVKRCAWTPVAVTVVTSGE
jgi:hypothetical protein